MNKFLHLKHWQIFTLFFGIPLIGQILIVALIITTKNPDIIMKASPVIMIIGMSVFYGWFYALGTGLHKKLPSSVKMNVMMFKIFLFIPAIYIVLMPLYIFGTISSGGEPNLAIFAFIAPLHLFSMFCMFYCGYFNAKALKAVETKKPVTFSDYVGEFFLIWFFPIGIWIIQPRINKIFED